LAALTNAKESEEMPIMYFITNINGTMNVLNKIQTNNFVYLTLKELHDISNPYYISKRAAEKVIKEYCTKHNKQDYSILAIDLSIDQEDYIHSVITKEIQTVLETPLNGRKEII